jgi:hypothetical protein
VQVVGCCFFDDDHDIGHGLFRTVLEKAPEGAVPFFSAFLVFVLFRCRCRCRFGVVGFLA